MPIPESPQKEGSKAVLVLLPFYSPSFHLFFASIYGDNKNPSEILPQKCRGCFVTLQNPNSQKTHSFFGLD